MCKISIVTVCYNAENTIERTMQSVLEQSCRDYEYVIIDGKSTDDTMNLVSEYKRKFEDKGIDILIISEKDKGIYNAMNKSIALARGEWLLFLNSGDYLYNSNVLEKISFDLNRDIADVVYGDAIFQSGTKYKYFKCKPFSNITEEQIFCHQCMFYDRTVISKFLYDEKYTICADLDLLVKLYMSQYRIVRVDYPISFFLYGGISTDTKYDEICGLDIAEILYKNNLIDEQEFNNRKKKLKNDTLKKKIKRVIKLFIPKKILFYKRQIYYQNDGWKDEIPLY